MNDMLQMLMGGNGQSSLSPEQRQKLAALLAYDPATDTSNPQTFSDVESLFNQAGGKLPGHGAGGAAINGLARTGLFGQAAKGAALDSL